LTIGVGRAIVVSGFNSSMIWSSEEEIHEVEMKEHIMCLIKLDNAQATCQRNRWILSRVMNTYEGIYAELENLRKRIIVDGHFIDNRSVSKALQGLDDLPDRLYNELLNAEQRYND
jgi:hypothetical protein